MNVHMRACEHASARESHTVQFVLLGRIMPYGSHVELCFTSSYRVNSTTGGACFVVFSHSVHQEAHSFRFEVNISVECKDVRVLSLQKYVCSATIETITGMHIYIYIHCVYWVC